jgi:putative endonuclease
VSTDPRHELGQRGEQLAADHLARLGYDIVTRNHRTRFGELDVVALADDTLVFCEVKTRSGSGSPFESLHARKRAQVRRMAAAYLAEDPSRPRADNIRFDAIGVVFDPAGRLTSLEHLEGAF